MKLNTIRKHIFPLLKNSDNGNTSRTVFVLLNLFRGKFLKLFDDMIH